MSTSGDSASSESPTVLVVDDEPTVLSFVSSVLSQRSYTVVSVASAEEALTALTEETRTIHLALVDVVLPGMSGPELVARLRILSPGTKCVFMSAYPVDRIKAYGTFATGCDFIRKPFMPAQLMGKVKELLDQHG